MVLKFYGHGYPWISRYPSDLDLGRHPCPWILSWAGQSEADGFGHGSGFPISVQTRSIAILTRERGRSGGAERGGAKRRE
jgi:hypothetical protein